MKILLIIPSVLLFSKAVYCQAGFQQYPVNTDKDKIVWFALAGGAAAFTTVYFIEKQRDKVTFYPELIAALAGAEGLAVGALIGTFWYEFKPVSMKQKFSFEVSPNQFKLKYTL